MLYASTSTLQPSAEELRITLEERESRTPQRYLDVSSTLRPNLVRKNIFSREKVDGYIFDGTIRNSASQAYFKDINVKVTFYSKTESRIGSRNYLVYEVISPGFSQSFSYKIEAPPASYAHFSVEVVNAVPVASSYIESRSDH